MNGTVVERLRRKRKSHFPASLTLRVSEAMKAEIDAMADTLDEDVAEVVRRALEAGLPRLVPVQSDTPPAALPGGGDEPETGAKDDIHIWWNGLTKRDRQKWGKRLRHIDGEQAFRAEAYRQAMAET